MFLIMKINMDYISVNNIEFKIIKLLGHGKGGYSYLVEKDNKLFVCKQIHHEPCSYYNFGNKLESEINDYNRLNNIGINMPKMLDVDYNNERILKEYIEGNTILEDIKNDVDISFGLIQVRNMANVLKNNNLNIDYFPTNFILCNSILYYIDYECNNYMEEWNFNNWGIKYWSKTKELLDYLKDN